MRERTRPRAFIRSNLITSCICKSLSWWAHSQRQDLVQLQMQCKPVDHLKRDIDLGQSLRHDSYQHIQWPLKNSSVATKQDIQASGTSPSKCGANRASPLCSKKYSSNWELIVRFWTCLQMNSRSITNDSSRSKNLISKVRIPKHSYVVEDSIERLEALQIFWTAQRTR